jgi:glucose/arabinose dehydrogenase/chitodextrinase
VKALTGAVSCVVLLAAAAAASEIPAGFQETTYVSGLVQPTAMAFGPSGELWITGKLGHVWLSSNGALSLETELPVLSNGEQGIEGIAVDPDYATNQFIWIYYTRSNPKPAQNVLSRFRHVGDQLVEETVMLPAAIVMAELHNGGCLRFAADKTLFVSTGDDHQSTKAPDRSNLRGKILHLNRDGSPAPDNPYLNGGGNPLVWASGFRNPWRFDIQPGSGNLFIGDVGESSFEEIDIGVRGGNFGWPRVEGPRPIAMQGLLYPIYSYAHPSALDATSVTGGDHVRGTNFPADYAGNYFFGDSSQGWIRRMILDASNAVVSVQDWAARLARPVDIQFGPSGALYYAAFDTGKVMQVAYVGGNNHPPAPEVVVAPDNGQAPLRVAFDASASSDADGDPLSFTWDFGDGGKGSGVTTSHVYHAGAFSARLSVGDGKGGVGHAGDFRVVAGNDRPRAEITAPVDQSSYHAGDTISYSGKATDPQDGTLQCPRFTWTVMLHYAGQAHAFLGPLEGACQGSFVAVDQGSSDAFFEIRLSVSDRGGSLGEDGILQDTQSVVIRPASGAAARARAQAGPRP